MACTTLMGMRCRSGCMANGALILSTVYGAYYIVLEPFAGITWTIFQGWPMWFAATLFRQAVPNAWAWAIGVHVLSWWAQVHIGHIMIEGSRPALTQSFFQVACSLQQLQIGCALQGMRRPFRICSLASCGLRQ